MARTTEQSVDKAEPLSTLQAQRRPNVGWKTTTAFSTSIQPQQRRHAASPRERLLARYPAHRLANLDPVAFEPSLIDLQRIAGRFA